MFLNERDFTEFNQILRFLKENEAVRRMKQYIQHGSVTTYEHGKNVAKLSYWMNKHFHLCANNQTLITGAFLHDFFLYDWHKGKHESHAWKHPFIAAENAVSILQVNEHVADIIRQHMWPINPKLVPNTKEAWIVMIADKCCSLIETLNR